MCGRSALQLGELSDYREVVENNLRQKQTVDVVTSVFNIRHYAGSCVFVRLIYGRRDWTAS